MTEKRFTLELYEGTIRIKAIKDNGKIIYPPKVVELLNELHEENNELRLQLNLCSDQRNEFHRGARENANRVGKLEKMNEQLKEHIKSLEKQCHLIHMQSMFSTVKSFKGDVSKRYKYSEKTDNIYDTANHYGQYDKVLDKKEITMLLNEYETILKELEE